MSHEQEPDRLSEFETRLAGLEPSLAGADRDRLVFALGKAWGRREVSRPWLSRWAWPSFAATMTAVSASLLVMLCLRPEPGVTVRIVQPQKAVQDIAADQVDREVGPAAPSVVISQDEDPGGTDVGLALRKEVLRHGVDLCDRWRGHTADAPVVVAEGPLPYHELLDRLLDNRRKGKNAPL